METTNPKTYQDTLKEKIKAAWLRFKKKMASEDDRPGYRNAVDEAGRESFPASDPPPWPSFHH